MQKNLCPQCSKRMTEIYWKRRQAQRTFRREHSWRKSRGRFQFWICKRCRLKKRR